MIKEVDIWKRSFRNSCNFYFIFMLVGRGDEQANYFNGWHRHTYIHDDNNYVIIW